MASPPDYYGILEVAPTATAEQIRTAYKKAALKWHPDRVSSDSAERPRRTKKFQAINDAYYTLSDPTRRRDYDEARRWHAGGSTAGSTEFGEDESYMADDGTPRPDQKAGGAGMFGGFPWSTFGFGNTKSEGPSTQEQRHANDQFGSVFDEMMADADLAEDDGNGQKKANKRFWTVVGGISGAALGFIGANFAGAAVGMAAGAKLGGIRDSKGKSVYEVFNELDQGAKARLLSELATKIFQGAIS